MEDATFFPQIARVTDLRYHWSRLARDLQKNQSPILVVEHSTPRAIIFPYRQTQDILKKQKDPLREWRKKYVSSLKNFDAVGAIREQRNKSITL